MAGSYVTHETNHFVYFYLDQKAVLLFKSGWWTHVYFECRLMNLINWLWSLWFNQMPGILVDNTVFCNFLFPFSFFDLMILLKPPLTFKLDIINLFAMENWRAFLLFKSSFLFPPCWLHLVQVLYYEFRHNAAHYSSSNSPIIWILLFVKGPFIINCFFYLT